MSEMARVSEIAQVHLDCEGPLLPILHEIQATIGYVSEEAIRAIASALNLSRAEVHGVVSFYHDFRTSPDQRPLLKVCRAEACQARGSEELVSVLGDVPGVRIEPVYCLGLCSIGPNAIAGDVVHARLNHSKLLKLAASLT